MFGRGCYGLDNQTSKTLRILGEKHRHETVLFSSSCWFHIVDVLGRKMEQTKYNNFDQKAFEQNNFILLLLLIANKFGGRMLWAGGRLAALHRNSEEAEEQTIDGLENQSCPPGETFREQTKRNAKRLNVVT